MGIYLFTDSYCYYYYCRILDKSTQSTKFLLSNKWYVFKFVYSIQNHWCFNLIIESNSDVVNAINFYYLYLKE